MPQEERFGTRDLSYSSWHRTASMRRFVGLERANAMSMIDIDCTVYVEFDDTSRQPLLLIETALDRGQGVKPATVTRNLAMRCSPLLPAYIVLYKLADRPNPADPAWRDIASFRVRRVWPEPVTTWQVLTPAEWAERLLALRVWAAKRLDNLRERGELAAACGERW